MARAHHAVRGLHALAHAGGIDRRRLRALENARAVFLGVRRKPERVVERMDVKALGVMHALEILRAAQHLAHLIGRPRLDVRAEIDAQHRDMLDRAGLVVGAAHGELAVARIDALHPGFGDRAANVFDARVRQRPQFLRARQPDTIHDRIDAFGKARRHEAGIAPRRAARNAVGLQHRDRPAAPRDLARDRQTRQDPRR